MTMQTLPIDVGDIKSEVRDIRISQLAAERTADTRDAAATAWFRLITIGLYAGLAANLMLAFGILLLLLTK